MTEKELDRNAARRLAIIKHAQEVTGNVALTCRYYGVWRILQRVDLSRLPACQRYQRADRRWKRYEKQKPGHAVQVDVKFIAPLSATSNTTAPVPGGHSQPAGGISRHDIGQRGQPGLQVSVARPEAMPSVPGEAAPHRE